jgi:hypothetical protein
MFDIKIPDLEPGKTESGAGLPDGFFSDQKSQFGYVKEELGMESGVIHIF